jgi:hypothetical protein
LLDGGGIAGGRGEEKSEIVHGDGDNDKTKNGGGSQIGGEPRRIGRVRIPFSAREACSWALNPDWPPLALI